MKAGLFLQLYFSYLKISFASFGGASMVPLVMSEMLSHGWMTETEVLDIVAIAEMTPGPLAVNCASFVGTRIAGIPGALVATLGVMTPTLTLCFLVAVFLEKFRNSSFMERALTGIRPAACGMILATLILLGAENYFSGGSVQWVSVLIGAAGTLLLMAGKLNILFVIIAGALMGLIFL